MFESVFMCMCACTQRIYEWIQGNSAYSGKFWNKFTSLYILNLDIKKISAS